MADSQTPKPTLQQSFSNLFVSIKEVGLKVTPHIGFIFFSLMLIGITAVVYIASQTMQSRDVGQGTVTTQKISEYTIPFDQTTITKLKTLSTNTGSPSVTIPTGRINPFSESVY